MVPPRVHGLTRRGGLGALARGAGVSAVSWFGLPGPPNPPGDILARLRAGTVRALQGPALGEGLEGNGFVAGGTSPAAFAALVGAEMDKWSRVAKAAGATID